MVDPQRSNQQGVTLETSKKTQEKEDSEWNEVSVRI